MGNTPSSPSAASPSSSQPPSECPVDHKTRSAYLAAAKASPSSPSSSTADLAHPPRSIPSSLPESRVISSIPRASTSPTTATPNPSSESRSSDPQPATTENWVYPSQRMFFDAMARKSHNPSASDMSTVVPIHNAVNERAWHEILGWENGSPRIQRMNAGCGGPKLRSFSGDSGKVTPRAWWRGLIGYERPFDRHDWVVERCRGAGVEYVIDFYSGKGAREGKLNFFLDVRPKLNSWEGWRMRVGRILGLG